MSDVATDDPGERLVDDRVVADRLDISTDTLMRMVNADTFPAPIMVGRLKRWRLKDVDGWIASRATAKQKLDTMATKYVKPQKRKARRHA